MMSAANAETSLRAACEPRLAPRRILMTADTGALWQHALDLAAALGARGHEVTLATMGRLPDRGQRRAAARIGGLELQAGAYRLLWMDDAWDDVRAAGDWLLDLAARTRPDIVHLNDFGHGHLPWPAPVLLTGHACVTSWWRAVHGAPLPPAWLRYRRRVAESLRAADLVVAPSHAMLRALRRHYGPLPGARVIANGRRREPPEKVQKGKFVFCPGALDDAGSNAAAIAGAAARIDWPVCVAGGARETSRRRSGNLRQLGASGGDALRRWLDRAPICVAPARYEGAGSPALDAALAGCALVLGDIDSLREHWDGVASFVAPDDQDGLVDAVNRLIADDDLRAGQCAAARRRAERFAPAAMAHAYGCAYAELGAATAAAR